LFYLKLDSSGGITTQKDINSTNDTGEGGDAIEVDSNGNVYISGYAWNGTGDDFLLIKMNSSGNMSSPNGFNEKIGFTPTYTNYTYALNVALDSANNCYFAGYSGTAAPMTAIVVKANGSGNITAPYGFAKRLDSNSHYNYLEGISIDDNDNIYLTGGIKTGSYSSLVLIKMNTSGNMTVPYGWQKTFDSTDGYDDDGWDVFIDDNGLIYISGYSGISSSVGNYLILRMNKEQGSSGDIYNNITTPYKTTVNAFTFISNPNFGTTANPFSNITDLTPTISSPGYILK
jgi:hypothetical protein